MLTRSLGEITSRSSSGSAGSSPFTSTGCVADSVVETTGPTAAERSVETVRSVDEAVWSVDEAVPVREVTSDANAGADAGARDAGGVRAPDVVGGAEWEGKLGGTYV